jgi:hypothetical protein
MKRSSSSSSSTQIIVKNNAPNWPAMVGVTSAKENLKRNKENVLISCAASSLWMKSRLPTSLESSKSASQLPNNKFKDKFASKTYLVRQCPQCQLIFSSFHSCSTSSSEEIPVFKKLNNQSSIITPSENQNQIIEEFEDTN